MNSRRHGGAPFHPTLKRMAIEAKVIAGLRVTTAKRGDVARQVFGGLLE